MSGLNILRWNSGSLNSPNKRISTLGLLRRRKIDIALLQEMDLSSGDVRHIADKFYHVIAFSSLSTKTRGVDVLARCNLNIRILHTWSGTVRRLTVAKVEIKGKKMAIFFSVCTRAGRYGLKRKSSIFDFNRFFPPSYKN